MPAFAGLRTLTDPDGFRTSYVDWVRYIETSQAATLRITPDALDRAYAIWIGSYHQLQAGGLTPTSRDHYLEVIRSLCFVLAISEIVEVDTWIRKRGRNRIPQSLLVGFPNEMISLTLCVTVWLEIRAALESRSASDDARQTTTDEWALACVRIAETPSTARTFDQLFAIGKSKPN